MNISVHDQKIHAELDYAAVTTLKELYRWAILVFNIDRRFFANKRTIRRQEFFDLMYTQIGKNNKSYVIFEKNSMQKTQEVAEELDSLHGWKHGLAFNLQQEYLVTVEFRADSLQRPAYSRYEIDSTPFGTD